MAIITHAKFHFNQLMLTLIFGIWVSEPPWAWRTTEKARSDRVKQGKKNKECIDQKLFKTEEKYIFDSIVLDKVCISILDGFLKYIRPFLHPDSDYLLVNRNGKQLSKLTDCLSILVFKVQMKCVFF